MLTEAEIKKKLYGDFDTESADAHSSTHEVKMNAAAFESQSAVKREFSSGATLRSPSFGSTSKPESITPRTTPSFSQSVENKTGFSHKAASVAPRQFASNQDWKASASKVSKAILGVLAGVLWKVGSYLVQTLDFILRLLDPRKPQARKLLYSITACILVAALFFGVFRLNAQRKKAMLGELRSTDVVVVDSKKPASPASVVAPVSVASDAKHVPAQIQKTESQESALKALQNSRGTVAATAEVEPSAPAVTAGKYVIQVATYAVLEDAKRVVQSINQAGFTAFLKKQIRNSTGHAFYPVYLGRFESSAAAQQTLSRFRKASVARPYQDSFIRTLE